VLDQIPRSKWNWLGHTLRRNDDSITKQMLQWTPQGHRGRGRPRSTWKRDLEKEMKEMWTSGYKYTAEGRWRRQHKTELDGDKWSVACGICSTGTGSDKA